MPPSAAAEARAIAPEQHEEEESRVDASNSSNAHEHDDKSNFFSPSSLLHLFLRINANAPRLDSSVWEFLTLGDLYQLRSLSKRIRSALQLVEYNRCRDGNDYLVPFPGYPAILTTPDDIKAGAGFFPHQLASLQSMHRAENASTEFGSLRGGIIADAPGLGKTITMLALLANTAGCRPVEPEEFYDNDNVDEHWKLMRTNPVFRTEILRAMKPLRDWVASLSRFGRTSSHDGIRIANTYKELEGYVSPPYTDDRLQTLNAFERHVRVTMTPFAPSAELDLFRRSVNAFKARLDKRNRRHFASDIGRRLMFERDLIPSSTTLIIVPDALLEHWAEQMRRHLNLEVFAEANNGGGSQGVVYIDGVGDLGQATFPLNHLQGPMPSPFHLMSHMVVVVPFSRIKDQFRSRKRRRDNESDYSSQSSLLQFRWFRIVVDEGHELGASEAGSDVTQFINQLAAERRWVLSGTPTTGDEDSPTFTSRGLDQLQRLLFFLRHPVYGTTPPPPEEKASSTSSTGGLRSRRGSYSDNDDGSGRRGKDRAKDEWHARVKQPFLKKQDAGRKELYRVLDEVMVMHKKEDINLPKPIFKQAEVSVPIPATVQSVLVETVCSYNRSISTCLAALHEMGVDIQRRGIDLQHRLHSALAQEGTSLFDLMLSEFLTTDKYQMLVDEKQGRYIADTVQRERRELEEERGGAVNDELFAPITAANASESLSRDRRPVKAVIYSESHNNLLSVADYLYDVFKPENIAEATEGKISDMSYELGRFRSGCKEGKNCPICGAWNEFRGKKLTGCSNKLLEVYDSEGRAYLIESERVLRAIGLTEFDENEHVGNAVEMSRLEGASLTKYGLSQKHWDVGDALAIDARDPHPLLSRRWRMETWEDYGVDACIDLMEADGSEGKDGFMGPLPHYEDGPEEVFVRLAKWQPCGRFHGRSRWYDGPTLENVEMRTEKEDVFILCLDASLSHGLDLSFVTHLFLLEPIDDAALLEQVTSRAHRLGCTGPVTVETVNVWREMDATTKAVTRQLSSSTDDDEHRRTSTAVCEHCYRSFENIEKAEIHELTCDRNPDSSAVVNPYHLSSVYRDIRPPPPVIVGSTGTCDKK
mmetsp:Transcript_5871/g.12767  ORF Transcript_5871/g.12767 Transcript_5871/m.12767 type:complete len:1099 (+) Transcript_5871:135-3431(+)